MQAGVPVVPIVIRNAGELMWRDALTVKPGTVQVTVLPPIDVSAWPADQIRAKTAEVQAMFADTLAHWPGGPQPPARPGPAAATVPAKQGRGQEVRREEDRGEEGDCQEDRCDEEDGHKEGSAARAVTWQPFPSCRRLLPHRSAAPTAGFSPGCPARGFGGRSR